MELAVTLVVAGLAAGLLLGVIQSKNSSTECYQTTKMQLADIQSAIDRFVATNDRFPVPAARAAGVEDPLYGREVAAANLAAQVNTTGGLNPVLFGALPFQALGLAPSYAGDCWGNKFTYAVSQNLTVASGGYLDFSKPGAITIKNPVTNLAEPMAYAVISHGEDGVGAVKINYRDPNIVPNQGWCTSNTTLESANCLASSPMLVAGEINDGKASANAKFDDLVVYKARIKILINGKCDTTATTTPMCTAGTVSTDNGATACSTVRTWHCDGANGGTNDTTCSYSNPICANCTAQSLSWNIGCSAPFPAIAHGATSASVTNTNTSFTTDGTSTATATCNNGVATASGPCLNAPPPVNGVCNNSVPLGCIAGGAPISDNGATSCGTTRSWICPGTNGGSNSLACSFANPACLSCSGSASWGGGCNAVFPPTPHGATTAPTPNTNPSFNGSATASCANGIFTATGPCSPLVPVNGACNNTVALGCNAGTASNDNGDMTPGNTRTWHCDGQFGGSPDTTCNYTNPGGGCVAGWGPEVVIGTEDSMAGIITLQNVAGLCTSGQGGNTPSTKGNITECYTRTTLPNWTLLGRVCGGAPVCTPNGSSSGGNPANCCNGDPDGNGVCGMQYNPATVCGLWTVDGSPFGTCHQGTVSNINIAGDAYCSNGDWDCTQIDGAVVHCAEHICM